MLLTGIIRREYSIIVEARPFSMFTQDENEIELNKQWCNRADAWGALSFDKWGNKL